MEGGGWAIPPTDAVLNRISQEFRIEDIAEATAHFSQENRLGEGTYGTVFRGTLRDGTEVAIKTLSQPKEGGFREEVEVLSKFRHPNLVILLGFARNGRERYLVYELLPGGDIHSRLAKDVGFRWKERLNVLLDAALGLSHLHGSRPQVFHRDVKTQNILMDRNGTGKVADFGLACLAQQNQNSLMVSQTSGTIGYADPLYIRTGVVTEGSEVYSFGMVMLETLTGRPPALQHPSGRIEYQFDHLRGDMARVLPMVDPRGAWPEQIRDALGMMSLRCISEQAETRPHFVEIVTTLRQWFRTESMHGAAPVLREVAPARPIGGDPYSLGARAQVAGQAAQPFGAGWQPQVVAGAAASPFVQGARQYSQGAAAGDPFGRRPQGADAGVGDAPRYVAANPAVYVQAGAHTCMKPGCGKPSWNAQPNNYCSIACRALVEVPAPRPAAQFEPQGAPLGAAYEPVGVPWPNAAPVQAPAPVVPATENYNEEDVQQLMGIGFSRYQALEAFKRCSTVEAAACWIMESMPESTQ